MLAAGGWGLAAAFADGFDAGGGVFAGAEGYEVELGRSSYQEAFVPGFGAGDGGGVGSPAVALVLAESGGFALEVGGEYIIGAGGAGVSVLADGGIKLRLPDRKTLAEPGAGKGALSALVIVGAAGIAFAGLDEAGGVGGEVAADGYFFAAAGFLGELKDALAGDAGYAGFAVGEVAFLGGQKAAEAAVLAVIDGVVAFVAVFAGLPGFGFGEGVGLVDGAVEGFAAVGGEGL